MRDMTFNKFIEYYFYNIDLRSRGPHIDKYQEVIKSIIKPNFKNFKLKNITPTQLNIFKNYCSRYFNNKKDIRYREAYLLLLDAVTYAQRNNLITNNQFQNYAKKSEQLKKAEEKKKEVLETKTNKTKKDMQIKLTEAEMLNKKYNEIKHARNNRRSTSFIVDSHYLSPNKISFKIDENEDDEIQKLKKEGRLEC